MTDKEILLIALECGIAITGHKEIYPVANKETLIKFAKKIRESK